MFGFVDGQSFTYIFVVNPIDVSVSHNPEILNDNFISSGYLSYIYDLLKGDTAMILP
jgi:hypothetical protein